MTKKQMNIRIEPELKNALLATGNASEFISASAQAALTPKTRYVVYFRPYPGADAQRETCAASSEAEARDIYRDCQIISVDVDQKRAFASGRTVGGKLIVTPAGSDDENTETREDAQERQDLHNMGMGA